MKLVPLSLTFLTLAGCSDSSDARPGVDRICGPDVQQAPCGRGVEEDVPYRFELLTHCGIEWAYLDGRYWVAAPKIDPPADWTPIQSGTITLNGDDAKFEGDSGGIASFRPAPMGYTPPPCA